jgi:hypothetical protein
MSPRYWRVLLILKQEADDDDKAVNEANDVREPRETKDSEAKDETREASEVAWLLLTMSSRLPPAPTRA